MIPNVTNSSSSASPVSPNWSLLISAGQLLRSDASPDTFLPAPVQPAQTQDSIEIGNGSTDPAATQAKTLPSLAVITQRIISEIHTEAKTAQKQTDERRAENQNNQREADVRQREAQTQERKQQAQKIDAARQAQQDDARTRDANAAKDKQPGQDAQPASGNPFAQRAQQLQGATAVAHSNGQQPSAQDATAASNAMPANTATTAINATPAINPTTASDALAASDVAASAPLTNAPASNFATATASYPTDLLNTLTTQLSNSNLDELSSVHTLHVDVQS